MRGVPVRSTAGKEVVSSSVKTLEKQLLNRFAISASELDIAPSE